MECEEVMWKQKSRVNWLQQGDQNTKFFHGFSKDKGKRIRITEINDVDGTRYEEEVDIQ